MKKKDLEQWNEAERDRPMKKQDRGKKMKEGPILVWHVEESFFVAAVEPG